MKHDMFRLRLSIQWALGRHEAWAHGPGGPRAQPQTKGLGSWAVPLGRGSGSKYPRDPCAVHIYFFNLKIYIN